MTWDRFADATTYARAPSRPPRAFAQHVALRDVDTQQTVTFAQQSEGVLTVLGKKTTRPVYFAPLARVHHEQRHALPTLLVRRHPDWDLLSHPRATHEGAFGDDYGHVPGTEWVAVWKFPADLNRIRGFRVLLHTPLPVGTYRMRDDQWWKDAPTPPMLLSEPTSYRNVTLLPQLESPATKFRVDLSADASVHCLRDEITGTKVAMIGTRFFVDGFWESDPGAFETPGQLLQALHDLGIFAFACYSMHHAIVFWADMASDDGRPPFANAQLLAGMPPPTAQRMTPARMARVLHGDDGTGRGAAVVDALVRHALPDEKENVRTWAEHYVTVFGAERDGPRGCGGTVRVDVEDLWPHLVQHLGMPRGWPVLTALAKRTSVRVPCDWRSMTTHRQWTRWVRLAREAEEA